MKLVNALLASFLPVLLVALAVTQAGCVPAEALCLELADSLRRCDLQPSELRCDAISYDDKAGLLDDVEHEGCVGFREADGSLRSKACDVFGWDCPSTLATGQGAMPRGTIMYVGGIDRTPAFDWHPSVLSAVARSGAEVTHVTLPPWASVDERSRALGAAVAAAAGASANGRVHLVCWAVSGIDCRYLVSPGGLLAEDSEARATMASAVASVTTLSTPHRGTYVATAALVAADAPGADSQFTDLLGMGDLSSSFVDPGIALDLDGVRAQLHRLQPGEMHRFNERVPDAPEVHYQSFAGVSHALGQPYVPAPALVARDCTAAARPLLTATSSDRDTMSEMLLATAAHADRYFAGDGETRAASSDGMIPVPSARWGNFRGCLPADHYDLVGQFADIGPDPVSGLDIHRFHIALASDLSSLEAP